MVKKRARPKRKTRRSSKKPSLKLQLTKIMGGLGLLIALVIAAGFLAYHLLKTPERVLVVTPPPETPAPVPYVPPPAEPTYEVYPKKDPTAKSAEKIKTSPTQDKPIVAIIIDDIGYDRAMADRFMSMDAALTLSILPYGPFTAEIASKARDQGYELMLHLPMEPNEYPKVNPGPGALLTGMPPDELIHQLNINLDRVPGLKGVNNHMGSRLTASSEQMRQVFTVLKKRRLYFVDSRTSAETVAHGSAQLLHVPFAERDIFIDHHDDPVFIRKQLNQLLIRARQQGYAVGIAHPHPNTIEAMEKFMPRLKKEVELVPASMVVEAVMYAEANGKLDTRLD